MHTAFVLAVREPLDAPDLHAIERPAALPKHIGIANTPFNAEPNMARPA